LLFAGEDETRATDKKASAKYGRIKGHPQLCLF